MTRTFEVYHNDSSCTLEVDSSTTHLDLSLLIFLHFCFVSPLHALPSSSAESPAKLPHCVRGGQKGMTRFTLGTGRNSEVA